MQKRNLDEANEEHVKISFNNHAFNPEVIDSKIFVLISSLTISILITVAVFVSFRESTEGRFPIMQFLVRFILSVITPLVIYFNNSSLVTYVQEMISTCFWNISFIMKENSSVGACSCSHFPWYELQANGVKINSEYLPLGTQILANSRFSPMPVNQHNKMYMSTKSCIKCTSNVIFLYYQKEALTEKFGQSWMKALNRNVFGIYNLMWGYHWFILSLT